MKALSIRQPWAWAILHAGKRIENRDWSGCAFRGPLLIHASKTFKRAEYAAAAKLIVEASGKDLIDHETASSLTDRGGIVGVCNVVDVYDLSNLSGHRMTHKGDGAVCVGCGWRRPTPYELALASTLPPAEFARSPEFMRLCDRRDPWAMAGGIGLVLADARPLPFVPCPGALGIFNIPDELVPAEARAA